MKVEIICEARGYPIPVTNLEKISESGSIMNPANRISNSEILIPAMQIEDEGEYKCFAENSVGMVEKSISIKMQTPWIIPQYLEVFSGSTLTLDCLMTHHDSYDSYVSWTWPDGSIIPDNHERFIINNNTLSIRKAFQSDSGEYSCLTSSESIGISQNSVQKDTAMVIVKSLPAQFLQTPLSMAKIPIPSFWYDSIELSFKFRTFDSEGTILYVPGSNGIDYFRVYIKNQQILTEWNLGSGIGLISGPPVRSGEWYYVEIERKENYGTMTVNGESSTGRSPGSFTGFDFGHFGFVGGGTQFPAFFGCILDMNLNGNFIDFGMLESIGISTCQH